MSLDCFIYQTYGNHQHGPERCTQLADSGYQLCAAEREKLGHSDVDEAIDDKALDASADGGVLMSDRTTSTPLRTGQGAGVPTRPRGRVPRCEGCGEADVATYCECCGQELCPRCWGAGDGALCGGCRGGAWEDQARAEVPAGLLVTDDAVGAAS